MNENIKIALQEFFSEKHTKQEQNLINPYNNQDLLKQIIQLPVSEQLSLWYKLAESDIVFDDILHLFKIIELEPNCILNDNVSMNSVLFNSFMMPYPNVKCHHIYQQLDPYIKEITNFDWEHFYIRGTKPLKYRYFFELFFDKKPIKDWLETMVQYRQNSSYNISTPIAVMAGQIYKNLNDDKLKEFLDNINICPEEEKNTLLYTMSLRTIHDSLKTVEYKTTLIEKLLPHMAVIEKEKLFFESLIAVDGEKILELIKNNDHNNIQQLFIKCKNSPEYLYNNDIISPLLNTKITTISLKVYEFLIDNNAPIELLNDLLFCCFKTVTSVYTYKSYEKTIEAILYIDTHYTEKFNKELFGFALASLEYDPDSFNLLFTYIVDSRKDLIEYVRDSLALAKTQKIPALNRSIDGLLFINYSGIEKTPHYQNIIRMLDKVLLKEKLLKQTTKSQLDNKSQAKI